MMKSIISQISQPKTTNQPHCRYAVCWASFGMSKADIQCFEKADDAWAKVREAGNRDASLWCTMWQNGPV